jgi:hypothetical protein
LRVKISPDKPSYLGVSRSTPLDKRFMKNTVIALVVIASANAFTGEPATTPPVAPVAPVAPVVTPVTPTTTTTPATTASTPAKEPWELITDKEIAKIEYDEMPPDTDIVTPFAPNHDHLEGDQKKEFEAWVDKFDNFAPGKEAEIGQKVRNWVYLATIPDIVQSQFEGDVPVAVFERLKKDVPKEKLTKALAWIVLKPDDGTVLTGAKDMDLDVDVPETEVRGRGSVYARKMLGRLLGKLPKKE